MQRRLVRESRRCVTSGAWRKFSASVSVRCTSKRADDPPRQTGGAMAVRSTSLHIPSPRTTRSQGVTHMADVKGPLDGIRVIDLGRHQAGPRCAQVLARLGAEVIKIERLGGEETRYHGPYVRKQSAYWVQYNSGKKSVSMDLRKEEGKTALRKLIKVSDVLVQN